MPCDINTPNRDVILRLLFWACFSFSSALFFAAPQTCSRKRLCDHTTPPSMVAGLKSERARKGERERERAKQRPDRQSAVFWIFSAELVRVSFKGVWVQRCESPSLCCANKGNGLSVLEYLE